MSDTFAEQASRFAGMTCRWLGWRPDDFWSATPAELAAIIAPDDGEGNGGLSRNDFEALMERDKHG